MENVREARAAHAGKTRSMEANTGVPTVVVCGRERETPATRWHEIVLPTAQPAPADDVHHVGEAQ